MQAVMKQETLAAIRALTPQFAKSDCLVGAMAAGNTTTCVKKETKLSCNNRFSLAKYK